MRNPFHEDGGDERRRQADAARREVKKQREDFIALMELPAARRVLFDFLQVMDIDGSPFSTNGPAQSYAIGKQDAARWWLNAIRQHCPGREAQMRAEATKAARMPPDNEDDSP